ncbi:MAG: OmpH family outer membrane protein [Bacteroidetes bacterium]|nr:OmpH family outer membrane protein [Bacteroidota bacterium]MCL5737174.1 OmpH family outer membrane protein [Bacteroidota bacterium]
MKTRALKSWLLVSALIFVSSAVGFAQQKIGWVDTQEIMKQLPEAVEAQGKLDALVAQWQSDINKLQNQLQQEANDYQKRRLILPEQARVQEEQKLSDLQKKIVDLRNQRFGQNGDLYQQQNTIMRPVQEKILKTIQDVAKEGSYDYIFDKSGQVLLMYANNKYDVTQQVLDKLKTSTNAPGITNPATPPGIH